MKRFVSIITCCCLVLVTSGNLIHAFRNGNSNLNSHQQRNQQQQYIPKSYAGQEELIITPGLVKSLLPYAYLPNGANPIEYEPDTIPLESFGSSFQQQQENLNNKLLLNGLNGRFGKYKNNNYYNRQINQWQQQQQKFRGPSQEDLDRLLVSIQSGITSDETGENNNALNNDYFGVEDYGQQAPGNIRPPLRNEINQPPRQQRQHSWLLQESSAGKNKNFESLTNVDINRNDDRLPEPSRQPKFREENMEIPYVHGENFDIKQKQKNEQPDVTGNEEKTRTQSQKLLKSKKNQNTETNFGVENSPKIRRKLIGASGGGATNSFMTNNQHVVRTSNAYQQKPFRFQNKSESVLGNLSDIYFIAIVACVSSVAIFSVIGAGYCFYKVQQSNKAAADVDFPAYGVIGPASRNDGTNSSKCVSPSSDRKLVQSAQIYHYHHQKQQMISTEKNSAVPKPSNNGSDIESDEENEDGEYTVYECPGLAPTGEMEIKNPLFQDDMTPMSSPSVNGSVANSKGSSPKTADTSPNQQVTKMAGNKKPGE